jgi:hypothetical protein
MKMMGEPESEKKEQSKKENETKKGGLGGERKQLTETQTKVIYE